MNTQNCIALIYFYMKLMLHSCGRIIVYAILLTVIPITAYSQQDSVHRIECLIRVKPDTILLRWVPASIPAWQVGNKYGYVVYRYTIFRDGAPVPDGLSNGELLTPQPIKPLSNEAFDELATCHPDAAIVQEVIYSEEFQMPDPEKGFAAFLQAYRELEMRFGFSLFVCDLSTEIAAAAGLYFADTHVKAGERYAYRIAPVNQPQGLEIQPAIVVADAGRVDQIPIPDQVRALFADQTVTLQWPVMLHQGIFTAYILEKSYDDKTYHSVSELPLINASEETDPDFFVYRDSLEQNGVLTYYRVRGLTPFGERSNPSESVSGAGISDFNAYAVIDTAAVTGEKQALIGWRITEAMPGLVKQITVQRASRYEGPYTDLAQMKPDIQEYTDKDAGLNNYYRIMLSGDNGLYSYSFARFVQLEDNDPPAPPVNITGVVDSAGIVTLAWQANTEPDIMGYRVFRANAPHEEFVEVTRNTIFDAIYRDTINLNTLTHEIWYKLVALDRRYNNSDYSEAIRLTRPDTIAPAPAVFTSLQALGDTIQLTWENSPSDDVATYTLYRKAQHDNATLKIAEWNASQSPEQYIDKPPLSSEYLYTLTASDYSGNQTHFSRTIRFTATTNPQIILDVAQESASKNVMLRWNIPAGLQAVQTVIYRAETGNSLATYRQLNTPATFYLDDQTEEGTKYLYRIKITLNNGQSVLSQVKNN